MRFTEHIKVVDVLFIVLTQYAFKIVSDRFIVDQPAYCVDFVIL
ncbi:hypothetical protein N040_10225 [Serratia marcescens EGD-HP20]|nr:hypothetical protein N040_10225 [Serratia marcescens EGD-HP20]